MDFTSHSTRAGLIALIVSTPLAAQWPSQITTGARVQVTLPEVQYELAGPRGHPIRGRVSALTPDSIYILVTDSVGALPIPRRLIQRLEYSRGSPSRFASAAQRGLIGGAATALLFMLVNEALDEPHKWDTGDAALAGGIFGAVTGGLTGALYPRERWKKVKLEGS